MGLKGSGCFWASSPTRRCKPSPCCLGKASKAPLAFATSSHGLWCLWKRRIAVLCCRTLSPRFTPLRRPGPIAGKLLYKVAAAFQRKRAALSQGPQIPRGSRWAGPAEGRTPRTIDMLSGTVSVGPRTVSSLHHEFGLFASRTTRESLKTPRVPPQDLAEYLPFREMEGGARCLRQRRQHRPPPATPGPDPGQPKRPPNVQPGVPSRGKWSAPHPPAGQAEPPPPPGATRVPPTPPRGN